MLDNTTWRISHIFCIIAHVGLFFAGLIAYVTKGISGDFGNMVVLPWAASGIVSTPLNGCVGSHLISFNLFIYCSDLVEKRNPRAVFERVLTASCHLGHSWNWCEHIPLYLHASPTKASGRDQPKPQLQHKICFWRKHVRQRSPSCGWFRNSGWHCDQDSRRWGCSGSSSHSGSDFWVRIYSKWRDYSLLIQIIAIDWWLLEQQSPTSSIWGGWIPKHIPKTSSQWNHPKSTRVSTLSTRVVVVERRRDWAFMLVGAGLLGIDMERRGFCLFLVFLYFSWAKEKGADYPVCWKILYPI